MVHRREASLFVGVALFQPWFRGVIVMVIVMIKRVVCRCSVSFGATNALSMERLVISSSFLWPDYTGHLKENSTRESNLLLPWKFSACGLFHQKDFPRNYLNISCNHDRIRIALIDPGDSLYTEITNLDPKTLCDSQWSFTRPFFVTTIAITNVQRLVSVDSKSPASCVKYGNFDSFLYRCIRFSSFWVFGFSWYHREIVLKSVIT